MNKSFKSVLLLSSLILGLAACSSDNVPTPKKLSQDVQSIPPFTTISVKAQETLGVPHNAETIMKIGTFKAIDNVYDPNGNNILIPRDAIITGVYTNDGVSCTIKWKAVYATEDEYSAKRGTLALGQVTSPSNCRALKGIKKGERAVISFKSDIAD